VPVRDKNVLYYGDNLEVLREHIATESVDLIYLDPPFNSNATYNVLFRSQAGEQSRAQIEAFDDTWTWGVQAEDQFQALTNGPFPVATARFVEAMMQVLGKSNMLAYIVMMAPRLVELRRVLKPTGSVYLHCDPTASHYLKLLLDSVFGPESFRSEIIWKRTGSHSSAKRWAPVHDTILYVARGGKDPTWTSPRTDYDQAYLDKYYRFDDGDGRLYWRNSLTAAGTRNGSSGQPWRGIDIAATGQHWKFTRESLDALDAEGRIYWPPGGGGFPQIKRYRDELKGKAIPDIWDDIDHINPVAQERLGYPTQKPLALLERIIAASSQPGDLILDPFCGCGTAVDAAQRLDRRWIGIDITYIAVDLIMKRLRHSYGDLIAGSFVVEGIPTDVEGARALFDRNHFDFERWAVSLVDGQPNEKQVADRGIDGRVRFHRGGDVAGLAIVSVKGGDQIAPAMVHQLIGAMGEERADMGLLILRVKPTAGMTATAHRAGVYEHPPTGQRYPKVQILTVSDVLEGKRPRMPPAILPYIKANPRPQAESVGLFDLSPSAEMDLEEE
jgi:DNA modification methylase